MKYISEFRDGKMAQKIAEKIKRTVDPNRHYAIMEFCGGHTHAIHRYGIPSLLPNNIELIHGPGCPVCILPIARIDYAIALAQLPQVILCSYGDMLRVPGSDQQSLLKAKAKGADVRMVYSIDDALAIARLNPTQEVIFFAVGFETTTPPTAVALLQAQKEQLKNFTVFCNHVLTPVAMQALLEAEKKDVNSGVHLDGFIGPSHVSIIIGSDAYKTVAEEYHKPVVIAGFEPLDVMQSIEMLIVMINDQRYGIENQYTRAVSPTGNIKSQQFIAETLALRDRFEWRGLGYIPHSAMKIKPEFADFDAELRFPMTIAEGKEHKACECPAILRGAKKPRDCKLFAVACTPENPLGSCMVSSEGACAAHYAYGRLNDD
ncbi:MAG: hypD [Gammaproteobacteria bacterium]|jgi:hydrogenase expression/formation protein HypD|nr:hypD [Gammaproteobacteria bacterium]